jgi:hypothetical protein
MDAHEWYRRQMVELREFEIQRDQPRARMARDAREASAGSRLPATLRAFVRRVLSAGRDSRGAVAADLRVIEDHDGSLQP